MRVFFSIFAAMFFLVSCGSSTVVIMDGKGNIIKETKIKPRLGESSIEAATAHVMVATGQFVPSRYNQHYNHANPTQSEDQNTSVHVATYDDVKIMHGPHGWHSSNSGYHQRLREYAAAVLGKTGAKYQDFKKTAVVNPQYASLWPK